MLLQKLYKLIFWLGYAATLIIAFIPIAGELSRIRFGPKVFQIRLDHLLHITAYFLISMYYLFGQQKGLMLFHTNPLRKFIVATLVLATVTEFVQLWVPERAFNILDWVANVSGIAVGLLLIRLAKNQTYKKS